MLRLKELREERGMTQLELANQLGIAKSSIGMYEQGRRVPSPKQLVNMAAFFDVSVEYLLGNTPVRMRPSANKTLFCETVPDGYIEERFIDSALQDNEGREMLKRMVREKLAELSLPPCDATVVKSFGKMMTALKDDDTKKIRLEIIKVVSEAEFTVEQLLAIHSFLRSFIPK